MRRRERFGLFPSRLPGFTRGRGREVQFELDLLPPVVLETHGLLTAPLVRAFSHRSRLGLSIAPPFGIRSASLALPTPWPTMPSADFCPAVRLPLDSLSRRSDTRQISWGKLSRLPCTVAGSTLRTLDEYGLRGTLSARPARAPCIRFLSIDSHICSPLPSDLASRRQPLRITNPSPPSGWVEDFHLPAAEHAQHTTKPLKRQTLRVRAGATEVGARE